MIYWKLNRHWIRGKMGIDIDIKCSKCGDKINFLELDRIRRAYITLTRKSRANSYLIRCISCGQKKTVRAIPINPFDYICRECKSRKERNIDKSYKQKL